MARVNENTTEYTCRSVRCFSSNNFDEATSKIDSFAGVPSLRQRMSIEQAMPLRLIS